ncbi:MAG: IclR family transcriptional regulator [Clostridiales Family XIII bacterium]|jgi:DNA-binding IclR family transcriptional regulator|nr:IclR family transcriptional regulator [Clostridiales Family XIII bacterium]
MRQKLTTTNQSVGKVLQIIEIMSQNRGAMKLQDISVKSGLPVSTALRMVNTLLSYGYVRQDPVTLRYALTLKFAQLGSLVSSQFRITDIMRPYLIELSDKSGEAVCYAADQDMELIYMDVIDGPDGILKVMQRIGKRAPLHCTGIGKIMLLNYSQKELRHFVSAKGLLSYTPKTIVTKETLQRELEKVRRAGYAMDDEECELGARCVAAGIKDYTGRYIGGISVSGPISRLTLERTEILKGAVMDAAKKISEALAYQEETE